MKPEILFRRDLRIHGECKQCGRCCLLAGALNYSAHRHYQNDTPVYSHSMEPTTDTTFERTNPFFGRIVAQRMCTSYDLTTRKCRTYTNRNQICPAWPMFTTDLKKVNCLGFSTAQKKDPK